MSRPIEDYAIIGDTRTVALVSNHGSIDWLCVPRFDSGACFAALLGEPRHGRWSLAPECEITSVKRSYRDGTLVLDTELTTRDGTVRITDCMPPDEEIPNVVRIVEGVEGTVRMRMELIMRFDYGWIVPWVRKVDHGLYAVGGPDALVLHTPVTTHGENFTTVATFDVKPGQKVPFVLTWIPSNAPLPEVIDTEVAIATTEKWWRDWSSRCTYKGEWREAVLRSVITLKAMTFTPTGGIVAAATTSLPERIGGERNWDYRYGWLRDATFTLYGMLLTGYREEAAAWRDWLLRAVAGDPSQLQVMYGIAGERRLTELTLPWLPGYAGSTPVRVGNAAVSQLQLDIYGEVIDALYQGRRAGLERNAHAWRVETKLLDFLEQHWREPDEGIWEVRGPRQHFTHSKIMAWAAFDRAVKSVESMRLEGPLTRWREIRDAIHDEVCTRAFDPGKRSFVQAYGSTKLDAALLVMPQVGFLPYDDPRVVSTAEAIERELVREGFVMRYHSDEGVDGMPAGEGVFLLCTFWLTDVWAMSGRRDEARDMFERLLAIRNDVGLLAEQYDPYACRLLGNFPQAFSHVGLVNTAYNLSPEQPKPAAERKSSR